jgi:hypothetical protein
MTISNNNANASALSALNTLLGSLGVQLTATSAAAPVDMGANEAAPAAPAEAAPAPATGFEGVTAPTTGEVTVMYRSTKHSIPAAYIGVKTYSEIVEEFFNVGGRYSVSVANASGTFSPVAANSMYSGYGTQILVVEESASLG